MKRWGVGKSFGHAEGGHKKLSGSFYAEACSFSHTEGGPKKSLLYTFKCNKNIGHYFFKLFI